jgi:hypothetical protein
VLPACLGTLEEMGEQTEDAEEVTVEKQRFVVVTHRRTNTAAAATAR